MCQSHMEIASDNCLETAYAYSSIEPFPLSKDAEVIAPVVKAFTSGKNSTVENLNRWISRFSRAKAQARRTDDLRRQVLLQNAIVQTREELRMLQKDRQKRCRELRSVLEAEMLTHKLQRPSYYTEGFLKSKMADDADKMAVDKMADDKMADDLLRSAQHGVKRKYQLEESVERDHSGPLPSMKSSNPEKKCRTSSYSCRMEDDEHLRSVADFLDAVHFETRHSG